MDARSKVDAIRSFRLKMEFQSGFALVIGMCYNEVELCYIVSFDFSIYNYYSLLSKT